MDYEKAYKELAKKAESFLDKWDGVEAIDSELAMKELKDMFNKFTESDDEKIRKEIIESIKGNMSVIHKDKCISWLEKQGKKESVDISSFPKEQQALMQKYVSLDKIALIKLLAERDANNTEIMESFDNIEPKFKVGDWIISDEAHEDYRICKIIWVDSGKYKIESIHGYTWYYECKSFDSIYRLWTIDDAKPGDLLANKYGSVFIYAGFEEGRVTVDAYCFVSVKGDEFFVDGRKTGSWYYISDLMPATKEQHELLFQRMHEAGYEWDAEKKELKKIDQNPTIEMKSAEESLGIDSETYNKIVDDCLFGDQKPAWSEEDERKLELIKSLIEKAKGDSTSYSTMFREMEELNNWIEFLKDRVLPQNTITDEELAHAKKDAYNEALDKNEYSSDSPTFGDGWDAAIWYLKKKRCTPKKNIEWIKAKQKIIDWTVDFLKYKGFEDEAEKLASLKQIF